MGLADQRQGKALNYVLATRSLTTHLSVVYT